MERLAGVAPRGPFLRLVWWFTRRRFGRIPGPLAVIAHQPRILQAVGAYELLLDRARLVDRRLKALASIKTASLVGCAF